MKTLACFLVTWVTAAFLLVWLGHDSRVYFAGGDIELTQHAHFPAQLWHGIWIGALYSLVNTFIVRFWQMQFELHKKDLSAG